MINLHTEITIYRGIIVALALISVVAASAAIIAVDRNADMYAELTDAQRTAETYRDGYTAALQRAAELEWQIQAMNGGKQK